MTDYVRPKNAEEARKLIGKRTPLPGGPKQQGPNFLIKREPDAEAAEPAKKPPREDFLNPRVVNARREREAGLACGGKVKKYAGGGSVRGTGCATKGKKFSGVY